MLDTLDWRKLGAEFLGTMVLVVIAVGVATETFGFHLFGLSYSAGVAATALSFGLVLVALVYAIGPISGCHVNPAVTLGFIASGRMKLAEGVAYLVAQFAGGIVGAYLLYWMFTTSPIYSKSRIGLGTDGYGKESHLFVSQWGAFLIEVVLTAIFVLIVLFATHKASIQGAAGVAIGFGLVIVHLIGIPLTGTSVNPARSLGPALVVGGTALSQVWLFIVAPLVGALIAAIIHLVLADRSGGRAGAGDGARADLDRARYRRIHGSDRGTHIRQEPQAGRPGHHPRQRAAAAVQHHVRAGRGRHVLDLHHGHPGQDGQPAA